MCMLFFDIDGTVVCADGSIPASAVVAIKRLQARGHMCFVNTGRPYVDLYPPLTDIPWDGYICNCGQDILVQGEHIYHHGIDETAGSAIIEMAKKCRGGLYYESFDQVAIDNWFHIRTPIIEDAVKRFTDRGIAVRSLSETPGFRLEKICFFYDDNSDVDSFIRFISSYCTIIDRKSNFFELPAIGCSKASGIAHLCRRFGTSPENCYAFGDSENDLSMLQYVGHPIVMQHAPESVRKLAQLIAPSPEHDGIYTAATQLGLI